MGEGSRGDAGVYTRRPYDRPQLGIVKLAADEVLVSGCKTWDGGNSEFSGQPCTIETGDGPPCSGIHDYGS